MRNRETGRVVRLLSLLLLLRQYQRRNSSEGLAGFKRHLDELRRLRFSQISLVVVVSNFLFDQLKVQLAFFFCRMSKAINYSLTTFVLSVIIMIHLCKNMPSTKQPSRLNATINFVVGLITLCTVSARRTCL